MAKRLTMAEIDAILTLHTTGHSNREIATLLGRNRETVGKYVGQADARNQPNAPTGTDSVGGDRDGAALLKTSQTRPPARQALRRTGRPATASRSGRRSRRRSSRAWRRFASTWTLWKHTARASPAITACGGSSPG